MAVLFATHPIDDLSIAIDQQSLLHVGPVGHHSFIDFHAF